MMYDGEFSLINYDRKGREKYRMNIFAITGIFFGVVSVVAILMIVILRIWRILSRGSSKGNPGHPILEKASWIAAIVSLPITIVSFWLQLAASAPIPDITYSFVTAIYKMADARRCRQSLSFLPM